MSAVKDLTGLMFNRLYVIGRDFEKEKISKSRDSQWICKCICGNLATVSAPNLKNSNISSCGCLNKEKASKRRRSYNKFDLSGEFGIGYTNKKEKFYFDKEDYDLIKDFYWYIDNNSYVVSKSKGKIILLHRLVMKPNENELIDHIFAIKFDNRKSELRRVSYAQNSQNSKTPKNNTSGRKGGCFQ